MSARTEPSAGYRLPDFLVIGAMKCGTTSLYEWLRAQPDAFLPDVKEIHFFSHEDRWANGLEWYARHFADAPPDALVGEASPGYTNPQLVDAAAPRIAATLPDARLVYIVRHPLERMRSQYRHEVQRNREHRPFAEAAEDYVGNSLYHRCLSPYFDVLPREQLCVVRFEDLFGERDEAWARVLEHLGLDRRPRPTSAHNVTAEKRQYTRLMLRLWDAGLTRPARRLPRPVRAAAFRLLTRAPEARTQPQDEPVPPAVAEMVWQDAARLAAAIGAAAPIWADAEAV